MTENELLPCSCGGEAYIKSAISLDDLYSGHVVIECELCGESISEQTIEWAIAKWNMRNITLEIAYHENRIAMHKSAIERLRKEKSILMMKREWVNDGRE